MAAVPFRRKLEALLPNADVPIALNFQGIEFASSSFLDELLGRLVVKIGPAAFKEHIRIVNISDTIRRIADVVIKQRMEN